ncbi:hypothetical protein [Pseudaquabacterium pictum]|uniref:Uncharacterized protein n=1 Tax=Pseudaquabacterium pictum TaxID=2315236 RepID=A0A480ALI7_9BURK|nr:hypothetical protein [Rubrivivax pictus]GCL62579.1 hypothetical protein AQPW35_16600 [Rubrivivax pictus]
MSGLKTSVSSLNGVNAILDAIYHAMEAWIRMMENVYRESATSFNAVIVAVAIGTQRRREMIGMVAAETRDTLQIHGTLTSTTTVAQCGLTIRSTGPIAACG